MYKKIPQAHWTHLIPSVISPWQAPTQINNRGLRINIPCDVINNRSALRAPQVDPLTLKPPLRVIKYYKNCLYRMFQSVPSGPLPAWAGLLLNSIRLKMSRILPSGWLRPPDGPARIPFNLRGRAVSTKRGSGQVIAADTLQSHVPFPPSPQKL